MFGRSANTSRTRRLSGPYRNVVVVLCAIILLTGVGTVAAGVVFAYTYGFDGSLVLVIAGVVLLGIATTRLESDERSPTSSATTDATLPVPVERSRSWFKPWPPGRLVACVCFVLAVADLVMQPRGVRTSLLTNIIAAAGCVVAASMAALVAHYFGGADVVQLPEAPALRRGARVVAWLFLVVAVELGVIQLGQRAAAWALHGFTVAVVLFASLELMFARRTDHGFPVDLRVVAALGQRANLLSSLLDSAQAELGIDLRSTWALAVARRFAQPLLLALCVLGWLSTCLTIVATNEVGIVERFGTVDDGPPLSPGIHLHWPWPVDHVRKLNAMEVHAVAVGHDGRDSRPEDVLWTRQHSENEYTLLLGDGHDLITIDAQIQYRVHDAHAFLYGSQNPESALQAIGYRAIMGATVSRTLGDALSENVSRLAASIQKTVQLDADRLGLGVEIVGFTIGGMHPPVAVALDYQAVVSAELGKVTAVVEAEAERNQTVPAAESAAFTETTAAQADKQAEIAKAAGDAWSFRTLQAQYLAAPDEFRFRRRLETLEHGLASRHFTIVDARIMRDGGELWLTQ